MVTQLGSSRCVDWPAELPVSPPPPLAQATDTIQLQQQCRPRSIFFSLNTHDLNEPVPEVLYLCTTCGGTLQSDEDGRWRRRRRPSSAPAAPGRRDTFFNRPPAWLAEIRDGLSRATASAGGRAEAGAERVETSTGATIPTRLSGWDEGTTAKLKYAPCARIIQHAYRDFRHRQYLRDWASALVRALPPPARSDAVRRIVVAFQSIVTHRYTS